ATAGAGNIIKRWSLPAGEPRGDLAGHAGPVSALRFSADGARLYSASADKSIRVWNPAEKKFVGRIDTPTPVAALAAITFQPPPPAAGAPAVGPQERLISGGG